MAFFLFVLAFLALAAGLMIGRQGPTNIQLGIAATCIVGAFVLIGIAVLLVKVNTLLDRLETESRRSEARREPSLTV